MNKLIITLLLMCSTYASAAMPAEGDSTTAGNQSMRVVTFKAVPGTERTYYYHHDHLGSTTLITNKSGEVVQRVEYLPTGETFIEQQDTSWVSPYKFNGKELDEETGLYYYGARYYDPRLSLWLGTDPMQGKYPGVSTYAYCMGNPVKFVDPDGLAPGDFFTSMDLAARDFGLCYNGLSILHEQEYGSTIYLTVSAKGVVGYSYSVPNIGKDGRSVIPSKSPRGTIPVADIHSHANYIVGNMYDNEFSGLWKSSILSEKDFKEREPEMNRRQTNMDIGDSNKNGLLYGYLTTPNGSLQKYNPVTGKHKEIFNDMPSDVRDPTRKNTIDPRDSLIFPKNRSTIVRAVDYINMQKEYFNEKMKQLWAE